MRSLGILAVLIGLVVLMLLTVGATTYQPCQVTITADRPDWWILSNGYGTYDLIVYPEHIIVFDLNAQQANNLKNANQIGLSQKNDGTLQLCSFR